MSRFLSICLAVVITVAAGTAGSPTAWAAERHPLLMPGKTTLYQRVLTRAGAALRATPHRNGKVVTAALPPLSMFFAYDRLRSDGLDWLELGPATSGETAGWIPADAVIDWKQTLIVSFSNPVNRGRALFFNDRDTLLNLIDSELLVKQVDAYRKVAESGASGTGSPVVSVEPETHIDFSKNFYLLPILDYAEGFFENGLSTLLLRVAAATLQTEAVAPLPATASPAPARSISGYRGGIVFVVDTTLSMDPYIDRTRKAIRKIYQELAGSTWGQQLSFGLVGFRDSIVPVPELNYVKRVFASLEDGRKSETFFAKVGQADAAKISSKGFNEDSYAGVLAAIKEIDWTGYDGRFVVLITDAGSRRAADPLSSTGRDAEQLRLLAQENGIAIFVLHLLTSEGRTNHDYARDQYEQLSLWPNIGSLYFPVDAGDLGIFGTQVDALAGALSRQIAEAAKGQVVQIPGTADDLSQKAALVGKAMQLRYLGRIEGTRAPTIFNAWVADRDLIDPTRKTLEVRVLLTKQQLSDLRDTLKSILAAGEATRITPRDFFQQVRGTAAALSRRPEDVGKAAIRRLADVGAVSEYLEDLPYHSRIMEITEDDWLSWSFGQQREFLDDLGAKIKLYEDLHDKTDLWIELSPARNRGEAVYPILLDALP